MIHFITLRESRQVTSFAVVCLISSITGVACADQPESVLAERFASKQIATDHATIKDRYVQFLTGTDRAFTGDLGVEASRQFLHRLRRPIANAMAFDFSRDADKPFRAFPGDPGHKQEVAVYSPLLQQYLLSLAYGYCVNAPRTPHYRNPSLSGAKVADGLVHPADARENVKP